MACVAIKNMLKALDDDFLMYGEYSIEIIDEVNAMKNTSTNFQASLQTHLWHLDEIHVDITEKVIEGLRGFLKRY